MTRLCALLILMAGACGSQTAAPTGGNGDTTGPLADGSTPVSPDLRMTNPTDMGIVDVPDQAQSQAFGTIFTILLENHDYAEIIGSSNAPYINGLIAKYGLATNYMDSGIHPSLPNYLALISGDTQYAGVIDLDPTTFPFPKNGDNLGNQMQGKGIKWRAYQESMGTTCRLSAKGNYAPKHDPFLYFDNIQNGANGLCAATSVDYSEFPADLANGTYRYMWITPNLVSDGHDPFSDQAKGLKQSDDWLAVELPKILASDAYKNNGVIFLTWDEAEGRSGHSADQVPMIIISNKLKSPGYTSNVSYSHASYLATVEDILGLPRLGMAASATPLMEFFK